MGIKKIRNLKFSFFATHLFAGLMDQVSRENEGSRVDLEQNSASPSLYCPHSTAYSQLMLYPARTNRREAQSLYPPWGEFPRAVSSTAWLPLRCLAPSALPRHTLRAVARFRFHFLRQSAKLHGHEP